MRLKNNKYNLEDLENKLNKHYFDSIKIGLDENKVEFFKAAQDLAYAILAVSDYRRMGIDFEETSYEYAMYLYERVFVSGFRFSDLNGKIAFTKYISLNIKSLIFRKDKESETAYTDMLKDLQFVIEDEQVRELALSKADNDERAYDLCGEIFDALRIFYTEDEINQKLPFSLDLIFESKFQPLPQNAPKDIKLFAITLICISKKIAYKHNLSKYKNQDEVTLKKALNSAARSSTFLASIADAGHAPLLLALDMASLFRLSSVLGGERISVPSLRQLNALMNTTVVAASALKLNGGMEVDAKTIKRISSEFDIESSTGGDAKIVSLQRTVSQALKVYHTLGEEEKSESLLSLLAYSLKSFEKLTNQLIISGKAEPLKDDLLLCANTYTKIISDLTERLEAL